MIGSALLATTVPAADLHAFDGLEPVGLAELDAIAALQTRVDRKYLIAMPELGGLFDDLRSTARILETSGRRHADYASTYFDTPAFDSYLAAARSRPNRGKVRVRSYLDSDHHYLEVKTRGRTRHTTKSRHAAQAEDHDGLRAPGRTFVVETLADTLPNRPGLDRTTWVAALQPTLRTHYRRATLLIEPPADDAGIAARPSRATIDTSLAFTAPGRVHSSHPGLAIIETKTAGPPSAIDRLLWRSGHRPVKVSKFGIGLALVHPHLPATKWNRVLRRHFGWRPRREA